MYLKYIEKDNDAEKEGMLELGKFYEIIGLSTTTFSILDDAGEKTEVPMLKMGIVPNNSKVRLVKDLIPSEKKGDIGCIDLILNTS